MKFSFTSATLLASLFAYVEAGATIYQAAYKADGTFCVDENARNLFAALNDIRTKGKTSTFYTGFKSAADSVSKSGSWTPSNNTPGIVVDKTVATTALADFDKMASGLTALNWSSGLAAAGQLLFDDFNTKGTTVLTDS